MDGLLGTLKVGALADLTLVRHRAGEWEFRDSWGQVEIGSALLEPVGVVRDGRYIACTPRPEI
jgi:predicted amidohydrolase